MITILVIVMTMTHHIENKDDFLDCETVLPETAS